MDDLANDSIFTRYLSDVANLTEPFGQAPLTLWPTADRDHDQFATIEEKHIFSNNLISTEHFGYSRTTATLHNTSEYPLFNFYPGDNLPDAQLSISGALSILYSVDCRKRQELLQARARDLEAPAMTAPLDDLDNPDYPAYTTGRAAEVLRVRQAFLRSLDAAGAVTPQRSAGGRRRYTRRQLAFAARIRELFDQGHTLAAALRILGLEDDLAAERALTARLHERLVGQDRQDLG